MMKSHRWCAVVMLVSAGVLVAWQAPPVPKQDAVPKEPKPADPPAKQAPSAGVADIADVPFQEWSAGGDELKKFFVIGPRAGVKKPAAGYRLVLVLPGGDGSAEMRPFVQRMFKHAMPDDVVVAQLVAPKWTESTSRIVWPTNKLKDAKMKFSTEEFATSVIEDMKGRVGIDPKRIDAFGWSSSGPAIYSLTVANTSPLRGAFIAMSVFKPETLPGMEGAKDKRVYLLHSPQDFINIKFPQAAEDELRKAGAVTKLQTYEGGHGWHGDVYGLIRQGVEWLEAPKPAPPAAAAPAPSASQD